MSPRQRSERSTERDARRCTILAVSALAAALASVPAVSAFAGRETATRRDTVTILDAVRAAKPHSTLDTRLERLASAARSEDREAPGETRRPAAATRSVAVTLRSGTHDTASLEALVAGAGGRVLHRADGRIEALLPLDRLADVAADDRVLDARALLGPLAAGSGPDPEAVRTENWLSDDVRAELGAPEHLRGTGIAVGIIDVGFGGYSDRIGTVLPAPAGVRCYRDFGDPTSRLEDCEEPPPLFLGSAASHGTAVSEAVVDVAPEVDLYLANPPSPLDLRETVEWMIEQGVEVINYSLYRLYEGPGDGTSPSADSVYDTIDRATARGVVWVGAAGNLAERHWRGPLRDADADGVLELGESATVTCARAVAGDTIVASLRWEDVWTAPVVDLDLVLLHEGRTVAVSADRQDGTEGHIPLEAVSHHAEEDGDYCLSVVRLDGPSPRWLELASFRHDLSISTPEGSIAAPADAASPGAIAVGAAPWYEPTRIEPFSSWGPTTDDRLKPDLVAFDRRPADSLDGATFAGTSQAAPHASGLAALVRQAFPDAGAPEVAELMSGAATPPQGAKPEAWGHGVARYPSSEAPDTEPSTGSPCAGELCLGAERFEVHVAWHAADGRSGVAHARRLTTDSAVFTFFDPGNVELLVKVLDGCSINQRHWVYAAGLTDLGVDLEIVDRRTGERAAYHHAGGRPFRTLRDTTALAGCTSTSAGEPATGTELAANAWSESVELGDGFRVSVRWQTDGSEHAGRGQSIGADSAVFAFFEPDNVELVVKLLDGRAINGSWWVFASGPTDVGVEILVEDLEGGGARSWHRPAGQPFQPVLDVHAFAP